MQESDRNVLSDQNAANEERASLQQTSNSIQVDKNIEMKNQNSSERRKMNTDIEEDVSQHTMIAMAQQINSNNPMEM